MIRSSTLSRYAAACLATTLMYAASARASSVAAPTAKEFMRVLDAQIQRAKPREVFQRTVVFGDVHAGEPEGGGVFPFTVSATIHDYNPGYPPNNFYGRTCVTRIVSAPYVMRRDRLGEWAVERKGTALEPQCANNPAEGKSAFPLDSLRGTRVGTSVPALPVIKKRSNVNLRLGEYACTTPSGRLAAGMRFRMNPDKTYTDLEGKRGGTYVFNPLESTLHFKGGFLDKMGGPSVENISMFQISPTLYCAPW